jgi:hypothetical protein
VVLLLSTRATPCLSTVATAESPLGLGMVRNVSEVDLF